MPDMFYRLCDTTDPEERLEDAAMWKAMRDEFGDAIAVLPHDTESPEGAAVFGRGRRFGFPNDNPVSAYLPYWDDPAFVANAGRFFKVLPFEEAMDAVRNMHMDGRDAFLKSTRSKHAIFRVPVGTSPRDAIGEMAYSFVDGGPDLMVQELCRVEFEHRFYCVDRQVVTDSPVAWSLTPIDRVSRDLGYQSPRDPSPVPFDGHQALARLARDVARDMRAPHAIVDCAMIDGRPGVVEFNPMRIGECGLYACDVRRLARAARTLSATRHREAAPSPSGP